MTGGVGLRGVLVAVLAGVAITVAGAVLAAVPWLWAVLIGLVGAALTLVAMLLAGNVEPNWSATPELPHAAAVLHASVLAARLTEAAADPYRFRSRIQPRLRTLAVNVLRSRPGLHDLTTLTDPRASGALGPRLHTLLTDPAAVLPDPAALAELLTALEDT